MLANYFFTSLSVYTNVGRQYQNSFFGWCHILKRIWADSGRVKRNSLKDVGLPVWKLCNSHKSEEERGSSAEQNNTEFYFHMTSDLSELGLFKSLALIAGL